MIYTEKSGDLFSASQEYYLAHCISGDYALGAGIAKIFNKVYDMKVKLLKNYPIEDGMVYGHVGEALLIDNVFNLVTKARYFHKPTYDSLHATLIEMKKQCEELGISKLAMPRIGSGLDKLDWVKVEDMIKDVFGDMDIEIVVYVLPSQ